MRFEPTTIGSWREPVPAVLPSRMSGSSSATRQMMPDWADTLDADHSLDIPVRCVWDHGMSPLRATADEDMRPIQTGELRSARFARLGRQIFHTASKIETLEPAVHFVVCAASPPPSS